MKLVTLKVIKHEKLYLLWFLYTIFFGLINIWAGLLMGNIEIFNNAIEDGLFLTFSISLCAPLCFNLLISIIFSVKKSEKPNFVTRKVIAVLINIILTICECFMWQGDLKKLTVLQILISLISVIFSFYMFCLCEMESNLDLYNEYNDKTYVENENESIKKKKEKLDDLNNGGKIGDIEL